MFKILTSFGLAAVLFLQALSVSHAATAREILDAQQKKVGTAAFTSANYKPGTIHHIVLFRYKQGILPKQVSEVRQRFLALKTQARRNGKPYIVRIEEGVQNSGEGVDGGYQQAFIVTFQSEGDRNYYVGTPVVTNSRFFEPAHESFKQFVGPLLDSKNGVLVFDF